MKANKDISKKNYLSTSKFKVAVNVDFVFIFINCSDSCKCTTSFVICSVCFDFTKRVFSVVRIHFSNFSYVFIWKFELKY